jgi:hypothetical protein
VFDRDWLLLLAISCTEPVSGPCGSMKVEGLKQVSSRNGNENSHGRDDFAGLYDDCLPQGGG